MFPYQARHRGHYLFKKHVICVRKEKQLYLIPPLGLSIILSPTLKFCAIVFAIMFSSHFLHLRCASISRTYAVQLAHPPACGACLTIIILSKYHLFTQMMALAMSVIFQDGGSRSSKQTTFWNKKKFDADADVLFWLWHCHNMYDYHPEFTLFSSHNQRTHAQSPNLTI